MSNWKNRKIQRRGGKPKAKQPANATTVPPGNPTPPPERPRRILRWIGGAGAVLSVVATLLGFVGFYWSATTRISVTPATTLNPLNPFETPFIIENQGQLPIYSIAPAGVILHAEDRVHGIFEYVKLDNSAVEGFKELGAGKKNTIGFWARGIRWLPPYFSAKAQIEVKYRPCLSWAFRTEVFTFEMRTNSSGEQIWFPAQ